MVIKKLILSFVFLFSLFICLSTVNAYTNISECTNISSAGIYQLNESLLNESGSCITMLSDNIIFDCIGYNITFGGNILDKGGINIGDYNNITIKNCILNQSNANSTLEGIYASSSSNITIYNNSISVYNTTSYGLYINLAGKSGLNLTDNTFISQNGYAAEIVNLLHGGYFVGNRINVSVTTNSAGIGMGLHFSSVNNTVVKFNDLNSLNGVSSVASFDLDKSERINITQNNISVSGAAYGILTSQSLELDIDSNKIHCLSTANQSSAIKITTNSNSVEIFNNTIMNNAYGSSVIHTYGIYITDSNSTNITTNWINTSDNYVYGIRISGSSYSNLENNVMNITDAFGLYISGNTIVHFNHSVLGNTDDGKEIFYVYGNSSQTLANLDVSELFVAYGNNLTITNVSSREDGVFFSHTENSTLNDSTFYTSGIGIYVDEGSDKNVFDNNEITSLSNYGIYITKANYNNITGSTISSAMSSTGGATVYLSNVKYNKLEECVVSSTGVAFADILLYNSNNSIVNKNNFTSSGVTALGVYLSAAVNNTISSNIVRAEDSTGYVLTMAPVLISDNKIYNNIFNCSCDGNGTLIVDISDCHNDFNTTEATSTNILGGASIGGNVWTNSTGGGYSSTCTDSDSDGFCDSAYVLTAGVNFTDYLPLKISSVSSSDEEDPTTTSSGGGGGGSPVVWTMTYAVTDEQFKEGFTKELAEMTRMRMQVEHINHYVGVVDISGGEVTINVSSTIQQFILDPGEIVKVDVNEDKFSDIWIKLIEITSDNKAKLSVMSIHDSDVSTPDSVSETEEEETIGLGEEESKSKLWVWIFLVVIVVICAAIISYIYYTKKYQN